MRTNLKTFPSLTNPVQFQWDTVKWRENFEAELKERLKTLTDYRCNGEAWQIGIIKEILGEK